MSSIFRMEPKQAMRTGASGSRRSRDWKQRRSEMPHPQEIDATEKQRWGALYTIDGWGIHRIARRYGRSTHTVWKFLRAAGVVRSREEAAQAIVSSGRRTWKGG